MPTEPTRLLVREFVAPGSDDPPTVGAIINLYLEQTTAEQEPQTYTDRRRVLLAFAEKHGRMRLANARLFHLQFWLNDQRDRWQSAWTIKRVISTIQRAFNWAVKLGIIERNPFAGFSHREGDPGRAMTDNEFQAMLRASSAPFRRVLVFLRLVGCRPCELSALELSHLDLDQGIAVLRTHKTRRTQKVPRPRVLILHPIAVKLVRYLIRTMASGQVPLFVNSRGTRWNRYSLATRIKRLRVALGLPPDCKLYGLRYALACRALRSKLDLKTLSVLLGHTTVRMTQRYAQIDGDVDHLHESVQQIFRPKK